jgi:predicted acylesterase/phospholipase RssA
MMLDSEGRQGVARSGLEVDPGMLDERVFAVVVEPVAEESAEGECLGAVQGRQWLRGCAMSATLGAAPGRSGVKARLQAYVAAASAPRARRARRVGESGKEHAPAPIVCERSSLQRTIAPTQASKRRAADAPSRKKAACVSAVVSGVDTPDARCDCRLRAAMSVSRAVSANDRPLGLALSGGGFRAAFFHVGVLAYLADAGVLRRVEVISTVSGGSIVGALYYLYVRQLLQTRPDGEIADADYRAIVERVGQMLLDGVETNVRGRAFSNLLSNFRMARPEYSRSDRLGELYDATFYRRAWNDPLFGPPPNPPRTTMIQMQELTVQPPEGPPDFVPRTHNAGRSAKVPMLVVNATSLNTGHNWRFEAVGMGEPDAAEVGVPVEAAQTDPREDARREVDRNDRLRWTRYSLLDPNQASLELGIAVAASACVPTLFHPLPVTRLFKRPNGDEITVQLVDGGVHDNQGIAGLLEFGCSPLLVSDASGYLSDDDDPSTRIPAVGGRSIAIYGDRVREEQLINARLDEAKRPLRLVHLRKGIPGHAIAPLGPNGEPLEPPRPEPPDDFAGEVFGVDQRVQDYLSKMRTDLDAFSEVEAYTLEFDAYRMAHANFDLPHLPSALASVLPPPSPSWPFLQVAAAAAGGNHARYLQHLRAGKSQFFKAIRLTWAGRLVLAALLGIAVAAAVALASWDALRNVFSAPIPVWAVALVAVATALLAALYVATKLPRWLRAVADALYTQVLVALFAIPLWIASVIVRVFSAIFVRSGRIARVLG